MDTHTAYIHAYISTQTMHNQFPLLSTAHSHAQPLSQQLCSGRESKVTH